MPIAVVFNDIKQIFSGFEALWVVSRFQTVVRKLLTALSTPPSRVTLQGEGIK